MKTLQALALGAGVVALSGGAAFAQAAVGVPNGVPQPRAACGWAAPVAPRVNPGVETNRGAANRNWERGTRYGAAAVPAPDGVPEGRWNRRWRDRDGDGRWDGRWRDRRYDREDRRYYGYNGWRNRGWYDGPTAGIGIWPFAGFTGYDYTYDDPVYIDPAPRRVWVERRGRGYGPGPGRRPQVANPSRGADSGT